MGQLNRRFNEPISAKQRTLIKMGIRALGISDGDYRDGLQERFGVRSCTLLNTSQASLYIKELEGKGFAIDPSKRKPADQVTTPERSTGPRSSRSDAKVICIASKKELEKFGRLAALIPWHTKNGLKLFLEKRMGIAGGNVRTSREAYRAIEGLKKLFESSMKKAYGPEWWTGTYTSEINEYIRLHKPLEWR